MKLNSTFVIGIVIAAILVWYMFTFQVRFDQVAVVTTFGKAGDNAVKNTDGDGAGLYFRFPWPIQQVRLYDGRIRRLEDQLEEIQLADKQVVVLSTYMKWRIKQPLDFFRTVSSEDEAEKQLKARLRDARAAFHAYSFDQLAGVDPNNLKLAEAEAEVSQMLADQITKLGYGIEILSVGVKRIILPANVSEKVFERMRNTRERLAQRARSEGDAAAGDIKAKAKSAEQRILAFAERRAQEIRAEGDAAAAEYYKVFQENEDFAVFLRKLDALRETLKHNTTFLLSTEITPFDLFDSNEGSAGQKPVPAAPVAE